MNQHKQEVASAKQPLRSAGRLFRLIPALIWMAVIFALSHQTGEELGSYLPLFQQWFPFMSGFDWGHFVAYFILALTYAYAFGSKAKGWKGKVLIVFLCVLYGVTDEYHQTFVDGRTPDVIDVRNDGIGAALAMLGLAAVQKLRKNRPSVP